MALKYYKYHGDDSATYGASIDAGLYNALNDAGIWAAITNTANPYPVYDSLATMVSAQNPDFDVFPGSFQPRKASCTLLGMGLTIVIPSFLQDLDDPNLVNSLTGSPISITINPLSYSGEQDGDLTDNP